MSVELILNPDESGEGEGFELAPNHAWREFALWAGPQASQFPALARLAAQKSVAAASVLGELDGIEGEVPEHVAGVRDALADLLDGMDPAATVLVD